jgi:hypothetical protein
MSDSFVGLSELSRKLNQASDRLNSTISRIKSKLGRLNLGLEVRLPELPIWRDDREEVWIGYCEIEGEWQLAVRRRTCDPEWDEPIEDAPDDAIHEDCRPLLKVGRGLRLDALPLVPKLVDEIKRRAESLLEQITEAEEAAEKL